METNNKIKYQNMYVKYPIGLMIYGVIVGIGFVFFSIYFFPKIKEVLSLSIIFFISISILFGNVFAAIYIFDDKILFKSLLGRKRSFFLKDLKKIDDWFGVRGSGYYFSNNDLIYFAGRSSINQKKIDEYKRFVYWLSDYKKSLYPDSDGIKIGRLIV